MGTIVDDDGVADAGQTELSHGFRVRRTLAFDGPRHVRDQRRRRSRRTRSWSTRRRATSRPWASSASAPTERRSSRRRVPVGTGQSRSLRWENSTAAELDTQTVRVQSGDCTTNCGTDDTYRVRAYETTLAIPRFNNTGTQVTILLLQNPTDAPINGTIYFWDATGTQVHVAACHADGEEPAGAEHGDDPGGERRLAAP